jgi:stearoyl-CoA desaturase (delta-9 desaturase)
MKNASSVVKAAGLLLFHLIPLALIWTGTTGRNWAAFGATYVLAMLTVAGGLHRYFSHRSFRTSRAFQFLMALMAGCIFGDAVEFSAEHRWHHRHSDSERDFHSPKLGIWQSWIGHIIDNPLTEEEMLRMTPDLACYPELVWLHRYWIVPGVVTAALFLTLGGYRMFACAYCLGILATLHGVSAVNYFCHTGRSCNFETRDRSSNSFILAVLIMGEGWHNNHHQYPSAARAGIKWYEIDMIYWLIKALSWIGVVWSVRDVPESAKAALGKRSAEASLA